MELIYHGIAEIPKNDAILPNKAIDISYPFLKKQKKYRSLIVLWHHPNDYNAINVFQFIKRDSDGKST